MSSKRIVCVMPSLFSGGAERQLCLLMEQLIKYGYDVTLVTYSKRPDMYHLPKGVKRKRINGRNHGVTFLKLFYFFTTNIRKDDIIISFCRDNNIVVLLANIIVKRYIIVGERNLLQSDNRESRLAFWLYKKKASYIVSNSYSQEKYLKKVLSCIENRISCIINYTDTKVFYPNPNLLNNDNSRVIGIFARYNPQKNYENFVKAVRIVADKGYTKFKFIWYGSKVNTDGSVNPHYARFQELIEQNGVDSFIELNSTTDKVAECINHCDAICLPSLYEGFSNSLAEAISCGKIVLASNTSDNPIMVEDGCNGYTFNPYNIDEMADAFIKYLNLPKEETIAFEKYSRRHAMELFNLEKFTNRYIELIENCK